MEYLPIKITGVRVLADLRVFHELVAILRGKGKVLKELHGKRNDFCFVHCTVHL